MHRTAEELPVDGIDARGSGPDAHFAGSRFRIRQLTQFEIIDVAVTDQHESFHGHLLRLP